MPKILRILNLGIVSGTLVSALSFFIPLIPCTKSSVIAEPSYSWATCNLPNPFSEPLLGISQNFFNYSTNPLFGLVTEFLIVFVIVSLISIFLNQKPGKILDLTRRKR